MRFAGDAIFSNGLDGVIRSWNHGAERLYSYRRAEIVGQPLSQLVPPDRAEELPAILERLWRGENVPPFDTVRLRRDGTPVEVSVTVSSLCDAAGQLVGVSEIGRDITARQQAEDDVRRIMTSARAMIWHGTVRQEEGGLAWDVRLSNEEAGARLWPVAVAPGQSFGEAWFGACLEEDMARMDANSLNALHSGQPHYSQEFRIRLADGSVRWLGEDVQIEPIAEGYWRLVGVYTDITDRKEDREALRDVMTSARAIFWHADVWETAWGPQWETRLSNEDAGARLWPVTVPPGESFSGAWYLARLPEDRERMNETSTRALHSGLSHYSQEFRIRLADGEVRWLGEDVQIERVGEGRWRLVGVCTDITERKAEQEALRDVLSGVRCVVWNARVLGRGAGMVWKINVFNEQAVRRWMDVPVAPGQPFAEAWAAARFPEESARCNATAKAAIETDQPGYAQEYRIRLSDGEVRWLAEDVQIEAQGPEEWHLAGVCTDITERKEAEEIRAAMHDRDRRIAETWHRSMLHETPAGTFPGLSVKTFYEAALEESQVGGDFYDAFALSDRFIALVVGDVSGKGLAAAGHTAEVKYALRAFLHAFPDAGEALAHLNDLMCGTQPPLGAGESTLVVLSLAVVDQITGEAGFAVAGGDPPLILRASGAVETVDVGGRLLGIEPHTEYPVARQSLALGDTLLMATDGIMEARRGRTFLGNEGLAALATSAGPAAPLGEIGQAVLRGAHEFTRGPLSDDACLLLARRM